jgi:hypothetical protein
MDYPNIVFTSNARRHLKDVIGDDPDRQRVILISRYGPLADVKRTQTGEAVWTVDRGREVWSTFAVSIFDGFSFADKIVVDGITLHVRDLPNSKQGLSKLGNRPMKIRVKAGRLVAFITEI